MIYKDPDTAKEIYVDFSDELVQEASRSEPLALGAVVFYPRDTGWYYEVTTAGRTAANYPTAYGRSAGETLTDGSVTLTTKHPASASVDSVSSVAWTVPTGLVLDSQRTSGMRAFVTLSGGTAGVQYDVLCRMTSATSRVLEKTVTILVAEQ